MSSRMPSGLIEAEVPSDLLFEQAIKACSSRFGLSDETVLRQLEDGDGHMHSAFRYGLAKELCLYLARLGPVFREMHVFGSSIGDFSTPTSDIDVIVVVEKRRDQIANLLKRLDVSLTAHYRRLVGLKTVPASLLDIHIIDRTEQEERSGYGAVIAGLHTRPICLWRSHPATTGVFRKENPRRSVRAVLLAGPVSTRY